uniref:D-aminoacyl-tRNA deacylase n=1 Tax=Ciona intestinalis TaxID=7719 RepID=H2XPR5_CIOIN|nr:D-aminoacyl-tRNA deacylase 1-like [Ciona intestinalis]|eukprot:XP_002124948.1 D-aminoacyl-tRNA deacylase 1-like [Ciona intestinalis]
MKAIVQRVVKAGVTVGEEQISSIGRGICVLVGISKDDGPKDTEYMVRKILNLRIFEDETGKRWAKSVKEMNLEILCVSQFTLQCVLKGNKPDFHGAMMADTSETFYKDFLEKLRQSYSPDKIQDGKFGNHMQVHIQNDGPVTIELNSPPPRQKKKAVEQSSEKVMS